MMQEFQEHQYDP